MKKIFILQFVFLCFSSFLIAQQVADNEKLHWWGDIDGFFNQQHKVTLQLVDEALAKYPPAIVEPLERKMAMLMLDGVLHEKDAAKRPAVQDFLQRRISSAIEQIRETQVKEGAMIWKLYNHGFVVRTRSVTIAFDLVQGNSRAAEGFNVPKESINQLVDECDVLFISHRHGDHADTLVAQAFIDRGKPVVAPPEVWSGKAIHNKITHLKREAHTIQFLDVQNGKQQLSVINYPGHQGSDIENNVVLVFTPEGMSFAHTGDQSGSVEEWDWIDKVGNQHRVDVLFPNCWTPDITRMIKGFGTKLVITGHENEMGHTIDHRESNWLTYTRVKGAPAPVLVAAWGEAYHYKPEE